MSKRSDEREALNRFIEARLAESAGETSVAATIYAQTLKEQPDNRLVAGKAYVKGVESGDFALAVHAIRKLELTDKLDAEMPLLLFADAFAKRNWRAAETASLEVEGLKNFAFMSPYLQAWIKLASGGNISTYLKQARQNPTSNYYYIEQTVLLDLAGSGGKNTTGLLDSIVKKNEARMAPIRIIAARHYLAQKNSDRALEILAGQRTGPEAKLYRDIQSGERKAAQTADTRVGTAFLFQRIGMDLGTQRAYFLALVGSRAANAIFPESDYGHFIAGRSYNDAGNSKAALDAFGKIDGDSPYGLLAISSEAAIRGKEGEYATSLGRLEAAIIRDPSAPELQILRGQILQLSGDNESAAEAFAKAIGFAEARDIPKAILANYWLSLGGAQEQAGIWPEGRESLRKALELQPESPNILNYFGYAQLERKENTKGAIAAIQKAYKLRSSSPAITDSLGWAYYTTGDYKQAVSYLERAQAGEPQDATINEHLGDAYWAVGRKYEARYAWKSAKLFAESDDTERLAAKVDFGLDQGSTKP